jgi:hypothetical protein
LLLRLLVSETLALQFAIWCAAMWAGIAGTQRTVAAPVPYIAAMLVGALCARLLAWGAVGPPWQLGVLFSLRGGATLLALPCGVFAVALCLPAAERRRFVEASLATLPIPCAIARAGCLVGQCCSAATGEWIWVAVECTGWLAAHAIVRRSSGVSMLLVGGALRLVLEGASTRPSSTFVQLAALAWIVAGLLLQHPQLIRSGPEREQPCT